MKNKKALSITLACAGIAAVIITAAVLIFGQSGDPEKTLSSMVKALNNLDFDAYVDTLHPALRADATSGIEQSSKQGYMLTLRNDLLSGYDSGSSIAMTVYYKEQLDTSSMRSLEDEYGDIGYNININDAYIFYYYSVLLPDGTPDGLDSTVVVKSGGKWYLLAE